MPGTRHLGSGNTGGAARWLAAALLVPALAACGSDGSHGPTPPAGQSGSGQSGNGQSGNGQSGNGQPDDPRTKPGGNQGGFQNAGAVSANVSGIGNNINLTLKSTSTTTFTAVISDVTDCTTSGVPAAPSSQTVTVTDGTSDTVQFTFRTNGSAARPVCFTATVGGESRHFRAVGTIAPTEGAGTSGGSTGTSGGGTPKPGSPGAGTASGSAH